MQTVVSQTWAGHLCICTFVDIEAHLPRSCAASPSMGLGSSFDRLAFAVPVAVAPRITRKCSAHSCLVSSQDQVDTRTGGRHRRGLVTWSWSYLCNRGGSESRRRSCISQHSRVLSRLAGSVGQMPALAALHKSAAVGARLSSQRAAAVSTLVHGTVDTA